MTSEEIREILNGERWRGNPGLAKRLMVAARSYQLGTRMSTEERRQAELDAKGDSAVGEFWCLMAELAAVAPSLHMSLVLPHTPEQERQFEITMEACYRHMLDAIDALRSLRTPTVAVADVGKLLQ